MSNLLFLCLPQKVCPLTMLQSNPELLLIPQTINQITKRSKYRLENHFGYLKIQNLNDHTCAYTGLIQVPTFLRPSRVQNKVFRNCIFFKLEALQKHTMPNPIPSLYIVIYYNTLRKKRAGLLIQICLTNLQKFLSRWVSLRILSLCWLLNLTIKILGCFSWSRS